MLSVFKICASHKVLSFQRMCFYYVHNENRPDKLKSSLPWTILKEIEYSVEFLENGWSLAIFRYGLYRSVPHIMKIKCLTISLYEQTYGKEMKLPFQNSRDIGFHMAPNQFGFCAPKCICVPNFVLSSHFEHFGENVSVTFRLKAEILFECEPAFMELSLKIPQNSIFSHNVDLILSP